MKKLRKLPWETFEPYLLKCLLKVGRPFPLLALSLFSLLPPPSVRCETFVPCAWQVVRGRFSQVPLVASLVSGLSKYHDTLAIALADRVLEYIHQGLEVPQPPPPPRRWELRAPPHQQPHPAPPHHHHHPPPRPR